MMELMTLKDQLSDFLAKSKEIYRYLKESWLISKTEFDRAKLPNNKVDIYKELEEAYQEWVEAKQYFNNVSEPPELIDHAAYLVQAAERKYIFYLKKIRGKEESGNL
ncbi:DUF2508 family protein [Iocasia frigidifontis]|uniref:DUF2508 family protein n=2 Tax=Iocasia fonsfrigidae TaxID=2682810 RepID=A0A8A7K4L0_9FIRM|nr:DUF2508 family protein [Iocasia fonsfrigidae]